MKTIRIDASALKQSACFLKFWRTCIEGYRSKNLFNDIEFGSAFHIFVKEYTENKGIDFSIAAAQQYFISKATHPLFVTKKGKEWMNVGFLDLVCRKYAADAVRTFNPIVHKGEVLVEKNFEIPFYKSDNVEILLTGTIDIIGQIGNGCYCIGDYKTTGSWKQDEYLEAFEASVQLPFYLLAIQTLGELYPDSIFADMVQKPIGCFIYGVFLHKERIADFVQSKVWFFDEGRMEELKEQLHQLCAKISVHIMTENTPMRYGMINDTCSGKYGQACEFLGACLRPKASALVLQNNFHKVDYNPLDFRKL